MILGPLIQALRDGPAVPADAPLAHVAAVLRRLVLHLTPPRAVEAPYGRYLLHAEAGFNLQLDVFSRDYRGGVHRHGTWGVFGVLRGALEVEDHAPDGALLRVSSLPAGGAMAFAAASDWHRVSTGPGEQVVSVHVYGPGFDLDVGEAKDATGNVRTYRRSPFGPPDAIAALLGS